MTRPTPTSPGGHTEGRWLAAAKPSSVVGWPVVAPPHGRVICNIAWQPKPEHVTAEDYDAFYRECEANARLIAACPTLLARGRELQAARTRHRMNQTRENADLVAAASDAFDAAISLAEPPATEGV